jgi:pimeloyl-ACP methyl ester carboxylesterase
VQPYGLTIPASYDGTRPMRLDVWLHGTQQQLNEVRFVNQQAAPHAGASFPEPMDYIQLEPFGRMNHSYRYYGETDVFEAIASAQQRYNIDAERILIRGHSMGGQGAWRLGLQHPGFFAALEASAGYVETKEYARNRLPKEGLPPYQEAALHYYDAEDYALNAFNIPTVGYGGEKDGQLRASIRLREALDDDRSAGAVPDRTRHRPLLARGIEGRVGSLSAEGARRNRRQGAEPRSLRHLYGPLRQRPLGDRRSAGGNLRPRRRGCHADK